LLQFDFDRYKSSIPTKPNCLDLAMSSSDVSDLEEEKKKLGMSKKRKNDSDVEEEKKKKKKKKEKLSDSEDSSDSETEKKKKKKDKKKEKKKAVDSDAEGLQIDDEGRVELGQNKLLEVSEFKGRLFVNIREWYTDKATGELKPGKKGIALNPLQWDEIKNASKYVDKLLKKKGR